MLEPVGIGTLAAHLRDGDWVDLRVVEFGTLQRVQIKTLNIHATRDEVVVVQKWPQGDEVRSEEFTFDAESVRWVRPSEVTLADVQPVMRPTQVCDNPDHLIAEVIVAAAFMFHVKVKEVHTRSSPDPGLKARQAAMWVAYEMTDLDPAAIAAAFGYKSQMPMVTCSEKLSKARWGEVDLNYLSSVMKLIELVEDRVGHRYRRQDDRPWGTLAAA